MADLVRRKLLDWVSTVFWGAIVRELRPPMTTRAAILLACAALLHAAFPPAEKLGRGVVVVRSSPQEVFVGWRLLATDPPAIGFNVYRHTGAGPAVLLTPKPLTGATHFIDRNADLTQDNYFIVHAVVGNVVQGATGCVFLPADAPVRQFLSIPLHPPEGEVTPDGAAYTYSANDASVGELDGDGPAEVALRTAPSRMAPAVAVHDADGTLVAVRKRG